MSENQIPQEHADHQAAKITPAPLRLAVVGPSGRSLDDLRTRLEASPWAWEVEHVETSLRGPDAAVDLGEAILAAAQDGADLIVLVTDASSSAQVFDTLEILAAIDWCGRPVLLVAGDKADRSLAAMGVAVVVATPADAAAWLCQHMAALDAGLAAGRRTIRRQRTSRRSPG